MDSDEIFARKLQNQIDQELLEERLQDEDLAISLAIGEEPSTSEGNLPTKPITATENSNSSDSDRTIDPEEDPVLFRIKSNKGHQKAASSDSDSTVDYSPPAVQVSDTDSKVSPTADMASRKRFRNESSSSEPAPKKSKESSYSLNKSSTSQAHLVSDSDSDVEKLASAGKNRPGSGKHGKGQLNKSSSQVHSISDTDSECDKPTSSKIAARSKIVSSFHRDISDSSLDSDATVDLEDKKAGGDDKVKVVCHSQKKPMCKYGSKCYRKNPSHLEEFNHTDGRSPAGKQKSQSQDMGHASTMPGASTSSSYSGPPAVQPVTDSLGFYLTKVHGIQKQHNGYLAMDIKDILSLSMGKLEKSAQFNYMTDIPWLVSRYPSQSRNKPLLIIHGCQRAEKTAMERQAAPFDQIRLCQARLEIPYGTHHTKMMLLVYDKGMRVVIHTSNLIENDWHQKTQGIWISPLFPKLATESSTAGDSCTHFKQDLLKYISAYGARLLEEWIRVIKQHDMSSARVYLVSSVPGRHIGAHKSAYGHLKLRKLLQENGPSTMHAKNWPVLGQFSSVGSLGAKKEAWVCGEWLETLLTTRGGNGTNAALLRKSESKLHLIFPSKDNVRLSLEGFPAGGSLPYSVNVARKQPWLHEFFHQWKSCVRGRTQASPHIKTYLRSSPDWQNIGWFLVTSANLSKAAWGALEKQGSQLMIRSYELGVLFLPEQFGPEKSFRAMTNTSEPARYPSSNQLVFPLPYDLPPTPYSNKDRPWVWDISYVDKPDTHGNMWCPS